MKEQFRYATPFMAQVKLRHASHGEYAVAGSIYYVQMDK